VRSLHEGWAYVGPPSPGDGGVVSPDLPGDAGPVLADAFARGTSALRSLLGESDS
jgi:hypothetical protein